MWSVFSSQKSCILLQTEFCEFFANKTHKTDELSALNLTNKEFFGVKGNFTARNQNPFKTPSKEYCCPFAYGAIASPTTTSIVLPFPFVCFFGPKVGRSGCLRTAPTPQSTHFVDSPCGGYLGCVQSTGASFRPHFFCTRRTLAVVCCGPWLGFGWLVVGSWVPHRVERRSVPFSDSLGQSASSVLFFPSSVFFSIFFERGRDKKGS